MKVKQETFGNVKLLRLDGKLDVHSTPAVLEILDELIAANHVNVVVDMQQVKFISSYGIGVLITTLKNIRERGGHLKLVNLRPEVKVPFEITGLLPQFEIYDDLDKAVQSF